MAILTKNQLSASNQSSFPDNTNGEITPTILRNFNQSVIDTLVDSLDTGSFATSAITGSLIVTASAGGTNVITFTKGNGTTFGVTIATGSGGGGDLTSLNAFTASQITKDSTLATYTGSVDTKFSTIGSQSGSWDNTNLNSFTQSVDTKFTAVGSSTASLNSYTSSQDTKNSTLATYTGSNDTKWSNLGSQSGSFVTESETGSFARTDVSNTFTATQTINADLNVSGTINAYKINTTIESSSVIFSSGSNVLGDATSDTQTLNGTVIISGSQEVTGSVGINGITTIKSNNGTPLILDHADATPTQNTLLAFFKSGSAEWSIGNLGMDDSFILYNPTTFQTPISVAQNNSVNLLGNLTASLQEGYIWVGNSSGRTNTVPTSSFATTGSNTFTGIQTLQDAGLNATSIVSTSGSLMLVAKSFTSASAHLSASTGTGVNLIFKNNDSTGDTIISGSNNIFTNPATPTTGYTRYIGGSNNLYLNNTSGINSQITQSAASVSGNRPTMNNNIFNAVNNFTINQAANSVGSHDYSQNILNGGGTGVTINALAHTGSISMTSNIAPNGVITINASSASLAEIATGISGSGTITIQSNFVQGGTLTNTSPRFPGFAGQTASGNVIAGGTITLTNISSSAAVNVNNNIAIGTMNYLNGGAAGLALHTTTGGMSTNYGAMQIIASASAINATGNISPGAMTVTNRMWSGSLGVGALGFTNNQIQGGGNTYTISGSFGGTGSPAMAANGVFGTTNTIFTNVEGRGLYTDFRSNLVGGAGLILTGSNNLAITASGGGYFGRFNANDGLRNTTGENLFVVGTGTSASNRKTGFLIDSGSNTFVEGTLNVSGGVFQNVVPITIASSTASLDLRAGTYFTLTLADNATTHINTTNLAAGVSATLVITTGTNSTASLSPILLQPSGSAYSATVGTSKVDVLSLVSTNASNMYVVSTKNMI